MDKASFPSCLECTKLSPPGTTPLFGSNPFIYSEGTIVNVNSFMWTNNSQQIAPAYTKYLPSAPSPTYLRPEELYKRVNAETDLNGWEKCEDGSLEFTNAEAIEKQKGVLFHIFTNAIKSLMFSNLVGLSLPARIFDSITMLEYFAYSTRYAPYFLSKAANLPDSFERFKLFTSWTVASLHFSLKNAIPLNPRLGETLQAGLEDGSLIFMEQVSHHPPITRVLYIGPDSSYTMYGKI